MGIFSSIAKKINPEEEGPKSEKRKSSVYRESQFRVPDDATREDLMKVLDELVRQKVVAKKEAKYPQKTTRDDLATKLEDLVRRGAVERKEVEFYLGGVIDVTRSKIESAVQAGKLLTREEKEELLETVRARFEEHDRDPKFKSARKGIKWPKVRDKLEANPEKMWSLNEMEKTKGEPDVVDYNSRTGEIIFMDCSEDCPTRSPWNHQYDSETDKRYEEERGSRYLPGRSVVEKAEKMGVTLLTEAEYRKLQKLGNFDCSGWTYIIDEDNIKKFEKRLLGRRRDDEVLVRRDWGVHLDFNNVGFRVKLSV